MDERDVSFTGVPASSTYFGLRFALNALSNVQESSVPASKKLDSAADTLMEELNSFGAELGQNTLAREKMGSALVQFAVHASRESMADHGASSSTHEEPRECVLFLAGEAYDYQFDVHAGHVRAPWSADTTIELTLADVPSFLDGSMNVLVAYLGGALRVSGDKRCALDLHETFLQLRPKAKARRALATTAGRGGGAAGGERRTLLTFAEEAAILHAVGWRSMAPGSSKLVQWRAATGTWVCVPSEQALAEARGLHGAKCCRVSKTHGRFGPSFEVLDAAALGAGYPHGRSSPWPPVSAAA